MSQKIAVFDIDGTFFRWQLYHELIFYLKDKGVFSKQVSQNLDNALLSWKALNASWSDYEMQVVKTAQNEMGNITQADLITASKQIVAIKGHRVYSYTSTLASKLKNEGYFLLAISGSYQEIAEIFAKKYGFDDCIGMIQKRDKSGHYIAKYERFVYGQKDKILLNYIDQKGFSLNDSFAIGDSSGDIEILKIVHNPIAFNPNKALFDTAKRSGWKIVIERKNIAFELTKVNNDYKLSNITEY